MIPVRGRVVALAAALLAAACQSPPRADSATADAPVTLAPTAPAMTATSMSNPLDALASPIEITLLTRCAGDARPRRINVSGLTNALTVVDAEGEARRKALSAAEIADLAGKLRDAKVASIAARPRTGAAPACTTTLKGSIDGAPVNVEESASSQIDPAWEAAWKKVVAALEAIAASAG